MLIAKLHRRTATSAVGPSVARGMGPKNTVGQAREYLARLRPPDFRVKTEGEFQAALDRATIRLVKHLPRGAKHWGAARKFLNIFMRDLVYNRFLCEHYDLCRIEPWLEVPLDSHVANGLREEPEGTLLPRWRTVIGLDKELSRQYQGVAKEVARRTKTSRVHLDILYWRREFIDAKA
jgi:hypothetical protein